jgi:hypothetical protein
MEAAMSRDIDGIGVLLAEIEGGKNTRGSTPDIEKLLADAFTMTWPADSPMMARGSGGFNIAPPLDKPHRFKCEVAPKQEDRFSALPQPSPVEESHAKKHKAAHVVVSVLSLVFNVSMVAALAGTVLVTSPDTPDEQVSDLASAVPNDNRPQASANLIVTNQKGASEELLPLGILVKNGSGEETVTISGLDNGVEFSLGTSQGSGEWSLPMRDLDQTYVGSFKNSAPVVQAAVKLYSASGRLLDSQVIRFEWLEKGAGEIKPFELTRVEYPKGLSREQAEPVALEEPARPTGEEPQPTFVKGEQAPTIKQLHASAVTDVETLVQHQIINRMRPAEMLALGESLLNRGDIAAARLALGRAAIEDNAQAALELAMTFDQFFLRRWGAVGTVSDAVKAREWYDKAMILGAHEASQHLDRLSRKSDRE